MGDTYNSTLEIDADRLVLGSANPQVITAVMRHRTLGAFVEQQNDATTVVLKTEAYPELVTAFDACDFPILDRVPPARLSHTSARASGRRHPLSNHQPPVDSVLLPDFIEMVRPHCRMPVRQRLGRDGPVRTALDPMPPSAGSMRIGRQT